MLDKDPNNWERVTWIMLLSAASIAYLSRLLERIRSKRVKSFVIESVEFVVCIGIPFGAYLVSSMFQLDERLVWLISVYPGHKGTRYEFCKLDILESFKTMLFGQLGLKQRAERSLANAWGTCD